MMKSNRYNPADRQREKQQSREQDDYDLRMGRVSADELAAANGFFSSLDVLHARVRRRGRVSA